MKKLFFACMLSLSLFSCDKTSIQQTTDNIKTVDSLFTKANDGIKTLDSISKTISDSNGITKKVIIPEIQKQKKSIDSTIKSGSWHIDSINKQIESITKNVVVGTEVAKTLDSANNALNNGENPLKVLSRTADKILNKTKQYSEEKKVESQPQQSAPATSPQKEEVIIQENPVVKTAQIEIAVDNLDNASALLKQKIRENNADFKSEIFNQKEGMSREEIKVEIPLQNFDNFVREISGQLGDVKSKATESNGTDYIPSQICIVNISLIEDELLATNALETENKQEPENTKSAFMKGFEMLEKVFVALLPFWPFFLILTIIGILWYRRRKKLQNSNVEQTLASANEIYPEEHQTSTKPLNNDSESKTPEDDYSKYLPKK